MISPSLGDDEAIRAGDNAVQTIVIVSLCLNCFFLSIVSLSLSLGDYEAIGAGDNAVQTIVQATPARLGRGTPPEACPTRQGGRNSRERSARD